MHVQRPLEVVSMSGVIWLISQGPQYLCLEKDYKGPGMAGEKNVMRLQWEPRAGAMLACSECGQWAW